MAISLAEEQSRMKRHPGIVFRDGATGRRPALEDGPQVWVLARLFGEHPLESEAAMKRAATETATWMELPLRSVLAAVRYYVDYRDEIDDWIRDLDEHSDRAEAAWRVKQGLAS